MPLPVRFGRVLEAARHAEVDDEMAPTLELEDQVLAAPAKVADDLAFECRRDQFGRLGPGQPWIVDGDRFEPAADEAGRQPRADRLDFGKLGHGLRE